MYTVRFSYKTLSSTIVRSWCGKWRVPVENFFLKFYA